MSDYPVPFRGESDGRWRKEINDDYRRAKSDDERRHLLLTFGYDKAHQADVIRLFGPPSTDKSSHTRDEPQETHSPKRERSIDEKTLCWTIAGVIIAAVGLLLSVVLAVYF